MPKNIKKYQDFVRILDVKITSTPKVDLLKIISQKLQEKIQFVIFTPNPEIILEANSNSEFKKILNQANFSIPDGFGLELATGIKRIKGRQFMLDLFKIANDKKLKVFLLGSKPKVNKKSLNILKSKYPNILASGSSGPVLDKNANPISEVNRSLQFEIINKINKFKPDLLFVAFGAPKQEFWISKNKSRLKATSIMTVGGSLDYFAGSVKPVPNLFENLNLEWLWRLIQEPKRLPRIFNALIIFPVYVILDKISSGSSNK